jgi:hypothetical protein
MFFSLCRRPMAAAVPTAAPVAQVSPAAAPVKPTAEADRKNGAGGSAAGKSVLSLAPVAIGPLPERRVVSFPATVDLGPTLTVTETWQTHDKEQAAYDTPPHTHTPALSSLLFGRPD